jgi:aromatic-L-amino-acid decarboxylase
MRRKPKTQHGSRRSSQQAPKSRCEARSPGNSLPRELENFGRDGRALLDWLRSYHRRLNDEQAPWPVQPQIAPGAIRGKLPAHPPAKPEPFARVLRDMEKIIAPGITHWQSPDFYGYFPANASFPSILGELASAGLGVQGMLWSTGVACTELETHVLDWLAEMLALPETFRSTSAGGGVIQDSASSATLCAILAARERATNLGSNTQGCDGRLVAYTSNQAHSSIEKGVKIAGIGAKNLRVIEVDEKLAMRADALARAIEQDLARGLTPFFVCATVGTTSTTAVDPLPTIGKICRAHNIWLHVDAAYAGTAALCPEFRWMHEGLELANSYCFDPHKWMLTNFDCTAFYVAYRKSLTDSLTILPEYLRNPATESGEAWDYRDWHVPLGRRFRALKLWFVIRHFGVEGLQRHVRLHTGLASQFAEWVRADARFELAAPVHFGLVCFRLKAGDAANEALLAKLNASGKLFLSHTRVNGRFTLRFCIGQPGTTLRHVRRAWTNIQNLAEMSAKAAS